jgi:hypothetical protein
LHLLCSNGNVDEESSGGKKEESVDVGGPSVYVLSGNSPGPCGEEGECEEDSEGYSEDLVSKIKGSGGSGGSE